MGLQVYSNLAFIVTFVCGPCDEEDGTPLAIPVRRHGRLAWKLYNASSVHTTSVSVYLSIYLSICLSICIYIYIYI